MKFCGGLPGVTAIHGPEPEVDGDRTAPAFNEKMAGPASGISTGAPRLIGRTKESMQHTDDRVTAEPNDAPLGGADGCRNSGDQVLQVHEHPLTLALALDAERPVAGVQERPEILSRKVRGEGLSIGGAPVLAGLVVNGRPDGEKLDHVGAPRVHVDGEPHRDDPVGAEGVGLFLHALTHLPLALGGRLVLVLETALLGLFLSLDFFLFLAFLAAQLASLADATVEPLAALVAGALVAALGLAAGALWGIDVDVLTLVPPRVRHVTRFASLVLAALIGCGAALTALALIAHWSAVVVLTHRIAPSVGDACGLLVASLMYLPNLMVWAMSYLVGPGFSLGLGTAVNPFTATGAVLPPLPLLAAVPSPAPLWGPLLLLVPVGIGALGRIALRRRVPSSDLWDEVVVLIAGSGVVGVVMAMLCAVSGGSLGSGRLVGLGPTPWAAGLAAGALTAAGAVLAALLVRVLPTMWVHGAAD